MLAQEADEPDRLFAYAGSSADHGATITCRRHTRESSEKSRGREHVNVRHRAAAAVVALEAFPDCNL